jgi:predicted DsbA family dithiol-disulfide isomerase
MREIMTTVDFYFDVMCPWAYQASKWIRAVHAERDIEVTWRFFSLEEFNRNEGKKHPWERPWSYGWSLLRIAAQCDHSRQVAAARAFDDRGTWRGKQVSMRSVYLHMIQEYARHNGHADMIRELLDGATGL